MRDQTPILTPPLALSGGERVITIPSPPAGADGLGRRGVQDEEIAFVNLRGKGP
jgi:hypothetical protein